MDKKNQATESTENTQATTNSTSITQCSTDEQEALEAVKQFQKEKPSAGADELHAEWRWRLLSLGWKFGKERDVIERTHPNLVAFHALTPAAKEEEAKAFNF